MTEGWVIQDDSFWLTMGSEETCCNSYNVSTLFLNLQKKSLTCSERGTLKTCYPLWSTVSLHII